MSELKLWIVGLSLGWLGLTSPAIGASPVDVEPGAEPPPNIVVIFIDDLGYADIGPFGDPPYPTPNLDRMAREGRRFTDFVAATAVCSASRAALMTGCYHRRIGISGALGPRSRVGINASEVTLAELCKHRDYRTACFGKWHLGWQRPFLPLQHGFDHYYGLPYSNDMWPYHPDYAHLPKQAEARKRGFPDLPLFEGNDIVDAEVTGDDQKMLTSDYTRRAVQFIDDNASSPFMLYLPHSMVHVPLFVSERFAGKSGVGIFGDVMMEVDWSVGQILDALTRNGIDRRTLVVFTSDNGPWLSYGNHAGSAEPLREGKGTMFEGGYRVPTLMWWPGTIPAASTCDELCSTIDIFPTVAQMIEAPLPDHTIDGKNILPLMTGGDEERSPHECFYGYYAGGQLQMVRDRQWKLHFPHQYRTLAGRPGGADGTPVKYEQAKTVVELYDLKNDPGETKNVLEQYPQIVERLSLHAENARRELGDKLNGVKGAGVRPAGRVDE